MRSEPAAEETSPVVAGSSSSWAFDIEPVPDKIPDTQLRRAWTLLRKLRREVGLNLLRIVWIALATLFRTARPMGGRSALRSDRRIVEDLRSRLDVDERLEHAFPFRRVDQQTARFEGDALAALLGDAQWRQVARLLAELATEHWEDHPPFPIEHVNNRDDAYYRWHDINSGKNDRWEYYLVPWLRTAGPLSIAYMDGRMRPYLEAIWRRHDRWFWNERPWMSVLPTGSNVSGILAGLALHALIGCLTAPDEITFGRYWKRYGLHVRRFERAARLAFDVTDGASVPMEGILYGTFLCESATVLGLIQERLGLEICVLQMEQISQLPEYILRSRTVDGDYQTSGDSRDFVHRLPRESVVAILSTVLRSEAGTKLLGLAPTRHFNLHERVRSYAPVEQDGLTPQG